jgi:hypothetical protein
LAGYGAVLGGRDYHEVNLSDSELWNVYLPRSRRPSKVGSQAGRMDHCAHGFTKEKGLAGRSLDLDVSAALPAPEPVIRNLVPAKTGLIEGERDGCRSARPDAE